MPWAELLTPAIGYARQVSPWRISSISTVKTPTSCSPGKPTSATISAP
ncbi:hypothetical protein M8494_10240 [Serratia ureilytica]